jgi:RNA polymerase sigma factor (sigma-70 family)
MTGAGTGGLHGDLETLFGEGPSSRLGDGELLGRFLDRRDESSERAFEALVARHGPTVYRVCRQVLGDSHEAHDAFQATFLVLARRTVSVRDRDSVGSWLYGVSLRVAARARAGLIRRRAREQSAGDDLDAMESAESASTSSQGLDAELVHREIGRLAEKYRAPVVLCYLEGLTHDEAAVRLNWPVGTVRSRLARARDQLRDRLARRGLAAPAGLGSLAAWLGTGGDATAQAAGLKSAHLPRDLVSSTVRAAAQFADGKTASFALFSATSLALTKGVLNSMVLENIAMAAWALLPAGIVAFAAGTMLGQEPAKKFKPDLAPTPVAEAEKPKILVDPLEQELLRAALARLEAQRTYYEEGRITIDRLIMASEQVMEVERSVSRTDAERLAAIQRHLDRLRAIKEREKGELAVGRGTAADLAEATQRRLEAEVILKKAKMPAKPDPQVVALERRLAEVERKLDELLNRQGDRRR